jgi:pilus assembly protein CpaD
VSIGAATELGDMTIVSSFPRDRRRPLALPALTVLGGLMVGLAGCANQIDPLEITGSVPEDYRRTHPIAIEESVETLDVPVGLHTNRMSGAMRSNVVGFAQRFLDNRSPLIAVVAPSGSANQVTASGIAVEIEDVLRGAGVPASAIDYRVYSAAANESNAPVRVAFSRIVAHTAPCGPWPDQASENSQNRNYHNFGCATQQNLAAMVANPLDLLYPRGLTTADAARRATVLEKYRKGESFTADLSREQGGDVAQGVGQ